MTSVDRHGGWSSAAAAGSRRLIGVLVLVGGFFVVELATALFTGSLALLADAGHMLADVGGVSLALLAIWLASSSSRPSGDSDSRQTCCPGRCWSSRSSALA